MEHALLQPYTPGAEAICCILQSAFCIMKILYVAAGIPVPGSLGGSTHAYEVARGLALLGHDLHLLAAAHEGWSGLAPFARPVSQPYNGFQLHHQDVPKALNLLALATTLRLAHAIRPAVIIERYYNFAGAGIIAARRLGIPSLLEVNALIVDPPQVFKHRLDNAFGGPMQAWAKQQCTWANRIVTPLHTTVPPAIPRNKIVELPWGADVERFATVAAARRPAGPTPNVVFLGSFRAWHGVTDFVRAALRLIERGSPAHFTLIGDGPERPAAEALAATHRTRFRFSGALPYDRIPDELACADVGVAPFNTAPHPALRSAGFFWSPLKIYEYMAAGLPVVTAAIPPLDQVIRQGQEGRLFPEGDIGGLADAIGAVLADPAAAYAMGRARGSGLSPITRGNATVLSWIGY